MELTKRVLQLETELRELRARFSALQAYVMVEVQKLSASDATLRLAELDQRVGALLEADPQLSAKRQAADVIDALQKLKKRGASDPDS